MGGGGGKQSEALAPTAIVVETPSTPLHQLSMRVSHQLKAALSQTPGDPASWKRIGPTFTPNNSWPITPKGSESNIKCSALFTMPGENASPRYYLFSGDVTPHGARVSSSDSLHGPWSRRELVSGGDVGKPGAWDDHMGCFTPPVELAGPLQGHLLSFCEWQPILFPLPLC